MLWLNSTHPGEAERLRSKNLQSMVEDTVMSSEVGGKGDGSTNQEGLSGIDQHKKLPTNGKNKDTVSSSTCSTAKKGRNASVCTTKCATSKQQSTQKKGEPAGQSTRKVGGSSVKKVDGSTTILSTGTKSGSYTFTDSKQQEC